MMEPEKAKTAWMFEEEGFATAERKAGSAACSWRTAVAWREVERAGMTLERWRAARERMPCMRNSCSTAKRGSSIFQTSISGVWSMVL